MTYLAVALRLLLMIIGQLRALAQKYYGLLLKYRIRILIILLFSLLVNETTRYNLNFS